MSDIVFIFAISLMFSFIENIWLLISASEFNLLQHIVLVEIHEENPALDR